MLIASLPGLAMTYHYYKTDLQEQWNTVIDGEVKEVDTQMARISLGGLGYLLDDDSGKKQQEVPWWHGMLHLICICLMLAYWIRYKSQYNKVLEKLDLSIIEPNDYSIWLCNIPPGC